MSEPFLGMIILVPYNFNPRGWAFCNGAIMSIAQNTALFSLLGTTYGGNGQTTFALPDLRGRTAVSSGQGPGLQMYDLGEVTGTESITQNVNQMPAHVHPFQIAASESDANSKVPLNGYFCGSNSNVYQTATDGTKMGVMNTNPMGGNQPMPILQPLLALNYVISLQGIFPSRN